MGRFWFFSLLFLSVSCQHKVYSPLSYEGEMLEWGTGGGFTGAVSMWCLLDNGRIYKSDDNGKTYEEINKISRSMADQFFNNYETLNLDNLSLNEPGNKYYFLTMKKKSKVHKLTWGYKELENKVPSILHKNLMNAVKTENK